MNSIILSNFLLFGKAMPEDMRRGLRNTLDRALRQFNITSIIQSSHGYADIIIKKESTVKGKLFKSITVNKLPIAPDSKMAIKLGRDYLKTERLTEVQYNKMLSLLFDELGMVGITCDIKMQDKENNIVPLTKETFFKPTKFPVA
jgi:hypothetical protein